MYTSSLSSLQRCNLVAWQDVVAEKRRRQKAAIPNEWLIPPIEQGRTNVLDIPISCGLLSPQEAEITTTSDVYLLLGKLARGEWSAVDVTTAFCKRAVIAHQLTNCLTEIFIEEAIQRANELDDFYKKNATVVGPLHGLPISLKDQFRVKGHEASMGYVAWLGQVAEDDSALVKLLRQSGAVFYVKTNVPQTLMWGETHNNVFGRTCNPHNLAFTPAGSSGGEAALLAFHGSILGVGSDVGGSIRNPSHFCGVYGFKPSSRRVPTYGIVNSLDGQDAIATIAGPMSTSLSGIKTFMQSVLAAKPWRVDPDVIFKPWDDAGYALKEHGEGYKLCFGLIWDDGIVKPHPPVMRALECAKRALENAGHVLIDWVPHKHAELIANARSTFLADGGADYAAALISGEPMIHSMKLDADPNDIPEFRKPREPLTAYQLWQLHKERRELRKEYFDHWQATEDVTGTGRPVDAIICPVSPYAAVPHGEKRSAVYTLVWNTLDCPSLVLPVTRADSAIDTQVLPHEFRNLDDQAVYELYDPECFHGLPVGLQVVGYRGEEEATIAMAELVDAALAT
ncbi:unnamed protein product [Somion occarium]|uniref:Amidase domain-containing protein n=1 Tax=Somion occarium TaxID=3059160 RepID=A0ABP1CJP1_9APHY